MIFNRKHEKPGKFHYTKRKNELFWKAFHPMSLRGLNSGSIEIIKELPL
jgi:hypothetical protein